VVLIGLAACAAHPSLLRWSTPNGAANLSTWQEPSLYVTSQPADPSPALTVKTLGERPAAAYVEALAAHQSDPDRLRASMATPIKKTAGGSDDHIKIARVFVVDVQRNGVRPGDRYMMTKVEIRPTTSPNGELAFHFSDYQAASTDYTTINVGTVNITSQVASSLSVTPTFAGASAATASYGVTNTDAATRNINERPQLSVNVGSDEITVLRTGAEGIDLAGNTLIKLSLELPPPESISYFIAELDIRDDKGALKPPKAAKLKTKQAFVADAHDIAVLAKLSYVDRDITRGEEYVDEGKQAIAFRSGDTGWKRFLILSRQDMVTPLWVIKHGNATISAFNGLDFQTLSFDDFDSAQEFTLWLKHYRAHKIGNLTLFAGVVANEGQQISHYDWLQPQRLNADQAQKPEPNR
jgi:hypothetical protein